MNREVEIYYSSGFKGAYERLETVIKKKAERRVAMFHKDAHDRRLDTHRLHGKLKEFWAFSIDDKYRIAFKFMDDKTVLFLDAGDHDIYK